MLRTYLNIKSGLIPLRAKGHIRFLTQGKCLREIQHLNPEKITFYKQQTVDLSQKRHAIFSIFFNGKYEPVRLYYNVKGKTHCPFPENTHGHLYYCAASPDRPSHSGSFRFRVTLPNDSEGFANGADLLRPDGQPWELSLYNAIRTAGYTPLVRKILNEGLVEPDLIDTVDQLPQKNFRSPAAILYTLSDPFTLSLGQAKMIKIITEDQLEAFRLRPLLDARFYLHPFTGTVLARFEKSELPEHKTEPAVVIRVLDILSTINCVIPDYDFHVPVPVKGQLIAKREQTPWSINISETTSPVAKCLGVLVRENTLPSP